MRISLLSSLILIVSGILFILIVGKYLEKKKKKYFTVFCLGMASIGYVALLIFSFSDKRAFYLFASAIPLTIIFMVIFFFINSGWVWFFGEKLDDGLPSLREVIVLFKKAKEMGFRRWLKGGEDDNNDDTGHGYVGRNYKPIG